MDFYSPTIVVCSSSFFIHLASNSSFSTRPFFPPETKCFSKRFHVACSTSTSPSAMASDARLVMNVVVDKCKGVFDGLESFVDIGGGTGTVAKAIADTFPDIECIVLDFPHVVAGFQGSKNLKYVGGDMFEAIPPADAVFMKVRVEAVKGDQEIMMSFTNKRSL